jgi:hypothetical protein
MLASIISIINDVRKEKLAKILSYAAAHHHHHHQDIMHRRKMKMARKQQQLDADWTKLVEEEKEKTTPNMFLFKALRHIVERVDVTCIDCANKHILLDILPVVQVLTLTLTLTLPRLSSRLLVPPSLTIISSILRNTASASSAPYFGASFLLPLLLSSAPRPASAGPSTSSAAASVAIVKFYSKNNRTLHQ